MSFFKITVYNSIFCLLTCWCTLFALFIPDRDDAILMSLKMRCSSFSAAAEVAASDFEKGNYHLIFVGERMNSDRSRILDSILRADYNIKPLYTGCISYDELEEYSIRMALHLTKLYGLNYFERAREKQVALIRNRRKSQEE
jgi:hypothetical protein